MLAVLSCLLEGRAGAVRRDAFAAELDGDLVRVWVRATHATVGRSVVQVYFVDDLTLLVVEPSQKRSGSEQASESAVGQGGERVS